MQRRTFLKLIGVTSAALAGIQTGLIEAIAKETVSGPLSDPFYPSHEYGNALHLFSGDPTSERFALACLAENLQKVIPGRYLKKIQFRKKPPTDFGRHRTIAWYYSPLNKVGYLGPRGKWVYHADKGVYVWERVQS